MRLLLDTHVWLRWLAPGEAPLPAELLSKIDAAEDLAVSAVSCWEVAYLAKRGRVWLPMSVSEWMSEALQGSGVESLPLTCEAAALAAQLSDVHRDPADRFIAATALIHHRRLLTLDTVLPTYPELAGHLA